MWNFRQIKTDEISKREDSLFEHVAKLIDEARKHLKTTIDTTMVYTYYGVGKYIVEDEQQGHARAKYGKTVLRNLSEKLTKRYGKGWSVETLTAARKFYQIYSEGKIANTVYEIQENADIHFTLTWSHYLILMRIANQNERNFYEIECYKQNWSVRQLQRQYNSSLYERLALSRNKDEVMRLAQEGQTIEKASDVIKSPLTLEFLGLKAEAVYSESKLESAIISKIQDFLLKLGKEFLFEPDRSDSLLMNRISMLTWFYTIFSCNVIALSNCYVVHNIIAHMLRSQLCWLHIRKAYPQRILLISTQHRF